MNENRRNANTAAIAFHLRYQTGGVGVGWSLTGATSGMALRLEAFRACDEALPISHLRICLAGLLLISCVDGASRGAQEQ